MVSYARNIFVEKIFLVIWWKHLAAVATECGDWRRGQFRHLNFPANTLKLRLSGKFPGCFNVTRFKTEAIWMGLDSAHHIVWHLTCTGPVLGAERAGPGGVWTPL